MSHDEVVAPGARAAAPAPPAEKSRCPRFSRDEVKALSQRIQATDPCQRKLRVRTSVRMLQRA
jgi:hypothetical protein